MEELYPEARTLALKGDYVAAADLFFYLAQTYPTHELAPSANYWLGECYYSQKEFTKAIQVFQKVTATFPNSTKAPAALLKTAYAYSMTNQGNEAMLYLKRLLEVYPNSAEAALVKDGKTIFRP
jgi:tol-pal system protein YbgF